MTEFVEIEAGQSKEMPAKKVLYGVPKIGKTRFAAEAEDAFFINIEGGLDYIGKKVRATPKLNTMDEVLGWLKHIYENDAFKCGTIIVDSIDWAERLAQKKLIKMYNGKSITDSTVKEFAYNKGVSDAASDTAKIMEWLDAIYKKKGIKALLIAHSEIKTVDLPTKEPYSRHQLKLSKQLSGIVNEWADLILFADYSFHVSKDGKPTEPKPVLYAGGSAAFVGGGRMLLDKELPLNYKQLEQYITKGK
jgi:hypothetical protein